MSTETEGQISHPSSAPLLWALDLLMLGILAGVLALPMLILGPMPDGHDTYQHLSYSRHFSEQFWRGDLDPKWLRDMNHGLGSPSFFVYPPFAAYVYTFLQPVGRLCHFDPFRAGQFLALFGSGLTAFLWMRTLVSRAVARASAVLYMLMPYHLAIDFYRRTALAECWAFVWMPLFFYFATRASQQRRASIVAMAVTYALLILSHPISAAIFCPIALAAVLTFSPGKKIRSVCRVSLAMGLGNSSFVLLLPTGPVGSQKFPCLPPSRFRFVGSESDWPERCRTAWL